MDAQERVSTSAHKTGSTAPSRSHGRSKSPETGGRFRQRDSLDADIIRNGMIDVFDVMEHVDFLMMEVAGIMCTQCLDLSRSTVNILSVVSQQITQGRAIPSAENILWKERIFAFS